MRPPDFHDWWRVRSRAHGNRLDVDLLWSIGLDLKCGLTYIINMAI